MPSNLDFDTLSGSVVTISFAEKNPAPRDDTWMQLITIEARDGTASSVVLLAAPKVYLAEQLRCYGKWFLPGTPAACFSVQHVESSIPADHTQRRIYLREMSGLSANEIDTISNALGANILQILSNEAPEAYNKIPADMHPALTRLIAVWKMQSTSRYSMQIAKDIGISESDVASIQAYFPDGDVPALIRENPFLPAILGQATFKACSAMASELGMNSTSDSVVAATLITVIRRHCAATRSSAMPVIDLLAKTFDRIKPGAERQAEIKRNLSDICKNQACGKIIISEYAAQYTPLSEMEDTLDAWVRTAEVIPSPFDLHPLKTPITHYLERKFSDDHAIAIYGIIDQLNDYRLDVIDAPWGVLTDHMATALCAFALVLKEEPCIITSCETQAAKLVRLLDGLPVIVTWPGSPDLHANPPASVYVIHQADAFSLQAMHVCHSLVSRCKKIIFIGDSYQPANPVMGNPFALICMSCDNVIDGHDIYTPTISVRESMIKKLKQGDSVKWDLLVSLARDINAAKLSCIHTLETVEGYMTAVAQKLGLNGFSDIRVCVIGQTMDANGMKVNVREKIASMLREGKLSPAPDGCVRQFSERLLPGEDDVLPITGRTSALRSTLIPKDMRVYTQVEMVLIVVCDDANQENSILWLTHYLSSATKAVVVGSVDEIAFMSREYNVSHHDH